MSESSYIFMLRSGGAELEVTYNQQQTPVVSEAQIFLKGDHVEGGCLFFIDEVYDMDKFIAYLSEIREKMVKHYDANPDNFHVVKTSQTLAEQIAAGPYCSECGKPQTKEEIGARTSLCFDCERKQILDKVNKPTMKGFVENIQALTDQSKEVPNFHKGGPDVSLIEEMRPADAYGISKDGFVCDQCGDNFDTKRQLQSHQVKSCPNPSL